MSERPIEQAPDRPADRTMMDRTDRPMDRTDQPVDRTDRPVDRSMEARAGRPTERPQTAAVAPRTAQTDIWPDMTEFRQRFDVIQAEFIEDPKSAVKKAETLMQEAIERMTKAMHERMQAVHREVEGKDGDTEQLRLTMRNFKMWMESLGDHRAA